MTRSSMLVGITFAVAAVFIVGLTTSAQQNPDWDAVEISTHHVAGTVHYVAGRGGNIGLSVGDDGVVMIDDQFAPLTDRIVEAIGSISNGNIRFLINPTCTATTPAATRTWDGWASTSWLRTASGRASRSSFPQ